MITADQLVLHAIGDYVTQSDWMAVNKTKSMDAALIHAVVYSFPFMAIGSFHAWLVILGTHAVIDRWRIARYLVWLKNWLGPNLPWSQCSKTGYPDDQPIWMSVWLMIICDNILHVVINGLALRYL
jgi:hypothetical protein